MRHPVLMHPREITARYRCAWAGKFGVKKQSHTPAAARFVLATITIATTSGVSSPGREGRITISSSGSNSGDLAFTPESVAVTASHRATETSTYTYRESNTATSIIFNSITDYAARSSGVRITTESFDIFKDPNNPYSYGNITYSAHSVSNRTADTGAAVPICLQDCRTSPSVSQSPYMQNNFTSDFSTSEPFFWNERLQEEREDGVNSSSSSSSSSSVTTTSVFSHSPSSSLGAAAGYDTFAGGSNFEQSLFTNLTLSTNFVQPNVSLLGNESSTDAPVLYEINNPAVGVLLAIFSLVVVVGNIMVIVAVFKEIYLRTVTNYFIVSLAIADVMVGGVVMPFSISNEVTNSVWLYGQAWCDLWRSLDVLASTASILNLCVISLDRYWAITDPIAYPSKMSNGKVCILIMLVWFCSAGISFPAIAWWKAVTPPDLEEHKCMFTEDSAYLIISAAVSFYIPMFIMMFVYVRIYRAAMAQTEGIKSGSKVTSDCPLGDNGEQMTLRIHRGGYRLRNEPSTTSRGSYRDHRRSSDSEGDSPVSSTRLHVYHHNNHNNHQYHNHNTSTSSNHHHHHTPRSTTFISKKIRHFALSKKITKLAREQKAAKTLGIVVGVFIICWLPFFCTTVLLAICRNQCVYRPDILFPVFTWLGYINSGMNPIIYALSMRDFRRAFSKMILCCPRYRYSQTQRHTYSQTNSLSTSSFSVSCGDRCVAMRI
ncbi:dopamine receptor 2 [Plakobranchus ocellatus]|uniref:Dopamine receptor 2 n=1 Tax=Plakobranchus ocellatus TaxID=259542 RepID=A0AAV4AUF5_9GAST|nr:dopamine receptor 2 [Plakobranchus ocellatus]